MKRTRRFCELNISNILNKKKRDNCHTHTHRQRAAHTTHKHTSSSAAAAHASHCSRHFWLDQQPVVYNQLICARCKQSERARRKPIISIGIGRTENSKASKKRKKPARRNALAPPFVKKVSTCASSCFKWCRRRTASSAYNCTRHTHTHTHTFPQTIR